MVALRHPYDGRGAGRTATDAWSAHGRTVTLRFAAREQQEWSDDDIARDTVWAMVRTVPVLVVDVVSLLQPPYGGIHQPVADTRGDEKICGTFAAAASGSIIRGGRSRGVVRGVIEQRMYASGGAKHASIKKNWAAATGSRARRMSNSSASLRAAASFPLLQRDARLSGGFRGDHFLRSF